MSRARLAGPLRGIVPPLVTPLLERDRLDGAGLSRLVEHVLSAEVAGLFVLGTTGEGPALAYRLRYELVEKVSEQVAGRVPVLVGVTDTSFTEQVELARWAEDNGAAAVVAAPPGYFPTRVQDLAAYFLRLADDSPLPVVLYNMPLCSHVAITPDVLRLCAAHENIAGFKDSSGDLEYFEQALALRAARPDWFFLVGPEHLLAEATRRGGDGGVNGGANLWPGLFVDLFEAARQGKASQVEQLQHKLLHLGRLYEGEPPVGSVIQGLKGGLSLLGICQEVVAGPWEPVSAPRRQQAGQLLAELGLWPGGEVILPSAR